MKKLILIGFVLAHFLSIAQDWNPFPENQVSYFKFEKDGRTYVDRYSVSKVEVEGETYYFFKSKGQIMADCFTHLNEENHDLGYYWSTLTDFSYDFYTLKNGEVQFCFFEQDDIDMYVLMNNLQENYVEGIKLIPGCTLNQKWGDITCTAVTGGEVLGASDSLKYFRVNGKANAMILSKNYGLIKIPEDFFNYLWGEKKQPSAMELIGFKTATKQKGYQQPRFLDYFNLQVGDVKYLKCYPYDGEGYNYNADPYSEVQTLTGVSKTENEVKYTFTKDIYTSSGALKETNSYTRTFTKDGIGAVLEGNLMGFEITDFNLEQELVNFDSLRIDILGDDTITTAMYSVTGWSIFEQNDACFIENHTADYWGWQHLSTKLGITNEPGAILIGTIISGKKSGNTRIITKTGTEKVVESELNVYPNPVSDWLTIDTDKLTVETIWLEDVSGKMVLQGDGSCNQLFLGDLPAGVYFVRLHADGQEFSQKVIKE